MKIIKITNEHQRKHFEFFSGMGKPHFNICFRIDVRAFLAFLKSNDLSFTIGVVFLISKSANAVPALRRRIRDGQIVEHDFVHPSFTVMPDEGTTFSFCEVRYEDDFSAFAKRARNRIDFVKKNPSFEDEEGRDDYLFLSSIPWIPFTAMEHAMMIGDVDSVPRITWGKYENVGGQIQLPVSVQAHHAVVDGRDIGACYEKLVHFTQNPDEL